MAEPDAPAEPARRNRRSWPQRLVLGLNVVIIVALVGAAASLGYAWSKYSRLPRVVVSPSLSSSQGADEPRNFLVVGVDSADGLDPDDPTRRQREAMGIGGLRSDTIMVLRIDPAEERARLLSLPRDLWVPLAGGGNQRINAALQVGGPRALIDTIEGYLDIPIHHYVQVDFAGFLDLVSAIGGVPLYFPYAARDRSSGLVVESPGCVTLGPEQSLAYARSRHYQYFEDGRWRVDPTGDLGRISRQQAFIRRALSQAVRKGIRNPLTLNRLLDVGLRSVSVDDRLTVSDLLDLGDRLRSFDPEDLETIAVPVYNDNVGGASVVRLVDDQAQGVLDRFRDMPEAQTRALTPSEVRVRVLNGSGRGGEAADAAASLSAVGFVRAGSPRNDDRLGLARTEVRYRPGAEAAADLVARWLVAGASLLPLDVPLGADVVVVTGLDYAGVADQPAAPTSSTAPPPVVAGEPDTAASTTTTVIGEVPAAPEGVSC